MSVLLLAARAALAADGHALAVPLAERGLTVRQLSVVIGAEAGVDPTGGAVVPTAQLPMRVGLTDDLELFAAPIVRSEAPILHEPWMGVTARFVDADRVEVGARAAVDLGLFGDPSTASRTSACR